MAWLLLLPWLQCWDYLHILLPRFYKSVYSMAIGWSRCSSLLPAMQGVICSINVLQVLRYLWSHGISILSHESRCIWCCQESSTQSSNISMSVRYRHIVYMDGTNIKMPAFSCCAIAQLTRILPGSISLITWLLNCRVLACYQRHPPVKHTTYCSLLSGTDACKRCQLCDAFPH